MEWRALICSWAAATSLRSLIPAMVSRIVSERTMSKTAAARPTVARWRRFAFERPEAGGELADEIFEVARSLSADAAAAPLLVVRTTGQSQLLGAHELAEEAA